MLPAYYEFHNPVKILSGEGSLENIPFELDQAGCRLPMILTDSGVSRAGLLDTVVSAFKSSETNIGAVFDEIPPDSSDQVVARIGRLYRERGCDSLVAVGGGSVIDTAKGVNILVSEGSEDLMRFAGAERLKNPLRPLLVVPTTAGTGSEATVAAVIYNEAKQVKMLFTSFRLLPSAAFIDPRMTLTMPPRITAATGMDALSHAVEAFTCLQKNPLSDAYATSAIGLIAKNLLQAVKNGRDKRVRLAMANASTMAGIAFSNSMVGMVHSLGHATGGVAHVPHGEAMSIFLPEVLQHNMARIEPELGQLLSFLGGEGEALRTPTRTRAKRSVELIRQLQEELHQASGLPRTLSEAGASKDQLGRIAKTAVDDASITFNPEEMTYEDALGVLQRVYA